ncbi:hypothetical protein [Synechococcus sp. PCC 6312]|uniref:hypothetical protein n=1 Tax=Synechococcus sp. (strain ATCC 27167 / PCC 6312) TaxID=195253 RepID=UPI00029F27A2|nr:hypothetical protein [Synechococcus sp. PCC 6312]AFY59821.1 hypothetical protein Syn6312_0600 [Synechococcus sp. PCC 6312]
MLETCPRCATRLGVPLKSGRQVCPHCGWSTIVVIEPPPESIPKQLLKPPAAAGFGAVAKQFFRVAVRIFAYFFNSVKQWFLRKFQTTGPKTGEIFKGLSEKLHELEESIPTGNEPPEEPWLYPREAFQELGGIPEDSTSQVRTLDGKFLINYPQFRVLHDKDAYKMLGLDYSPERQQKGLTYLRRLSRGSKSTKS